MTVEYCMYTSRLLLTGYSAATAYMVAPATVAAVYPQRYSNLL